MSRRARESASQKVSESASQRVSESASQSGSESVRLSQWAVSQEVPVLCIFFQPHDDCVVFTFLEPQLKGRVAFACTLFVTFDFEQQTLSFPQIGGLEPGGLVVKEGLPMKPLQVPGTRSSPNPNHRSKPPMKHHPPQQRFSPFPKSRDLFKKQRSLGTVRWLPKISASL